jgi:hypothetical protein
MLLLLLLLLSLMLLWELFCYLTSLYALAAASVIAVVVVVTNKISLQAFQLFNGTMTLRIIILLPLQLLNLQAFNSLFTVISKVI